MSYRVVYGPMPREKSGRKGIFRLQMMTAVCLLMLSLGIRTAWPEGREVLRHYLIPGTETVTQEAFGDMIEGLQAGQSVREAVTAFCRQIVQHELREAS